MGKYIIAGLKTEFEPKYDFLRERAKAYETDFEDSEVDIKIELKDEFIINEKKKTPRMTIEEHEYFWTGQVFNSRLIDYNGLMVHSSCVEKDGFAYLFSADSGTGKSTHTHLWLKNLSGTRIINDDKPVLIKENDVWYAYGTPFSGKTDENVNVKVPVRAIVFLKRGNENKVSRLPVGEAIKLLFGQVMRPNNASYAAKVLDMVDSVLSSVSIFSLECNMDDEAAIVSYNNIERLIRNED